MRSILLTLAFLAGSADAQLLLTCAPGVPCGPTGPTNTQTGLPAWEAGYYINNNFESLWPLLSAVSVPQPAGVQQATCTKVSTTIGSNQISISGCLTNPGQAAPTFTSSNVGQTIAITGYGTVTQSNATVSTTITSLVSSSPCVASGSNVCILTLGANAYNVLSPPNNITASISGNTMTVTSVTSSTLNKGQTITWPTSHVGETNPLGNTTITALGTGTGGTGTYTVSQTQTVASEALVASTTSLIAWGPCCADSTALNAAIAGGGLQLERNAVYGVGSIAGSTAGITIPASTINKVDFNGALIVCLTPLTDEVLVPSGNYLAGYSSSFRGGGYLDGMGLCGDNIHAQVKGVNYDGFDLKNPTTENITCDGYCTGTNWTNINIDNAHPGGPANFNFALAPTTCVDNVNAPGAQSDNHFEHMNVTGCQNYGFWFEIGSGVAHGDDLHVYEIYNPASYQSITCTNTNATAGQQTLTITLSSCTNTSPSFPVGNQIYISNLGAGNNIFGTAVLSYSASGGVGTITTGYPNSSYPVNGVTLTNATSTITWGTYPAFFRMDSDTQLSLAYVDNLSYYAANQIGFDITQGTAILTSSFIHSPGTYAPIAPIRVGSNLHQVILRGNTCFGVYPNLPNAASGGPSPTASSVPGILELGPVYDGDIDSGGDCYIGAQAPQNGLASLGSGGNQFADLSGTTSPPNSTGIYTLGILAPTLYSAATAPVTYPNVATLTLLAPNCATNTFSGFAVTCTNLYGLWDAGGAYLAGQISLNVSGSNSTYINTGASTGNVNIQNQTGTGNVYIGNPADTITLGVTNTGTATKYVCTDNTGKIIIQAGAC